MVAAGTSRGSSTILAAVLLVLVCSVAVGLSPSSAPSPPTCSAQPSPPPESDPSNPFCFECLCSLDDPLQCHALVSLLKATTWRRDVVLCGALVTYCAWPGVLCGGPSGGNVVALDLSNRGYSGSVPVELGARLTALSLLDLSGNRLSGSLPDTFDLLSQLEAVNLSENDFEGSLPASLLALSELRYLNVTGNVRLSGAVPHALKQSSESYLRPAMPSFAACAANCEGGANFSCFQQQQSPSPSNPSPAPPPSQSSPAFIFEWVLPIASATPGYRNPNITQATLGLTICANAWRTGSWSTSSIRPPSSYTTALKNSQLAGAYASFVPTWGTSTAKYEEVRQVRLSRDARVH